jgi:hypothetical protein
MSQEDERNPLLPSHCSAVKDLCKCTGTLKLKATRLEWNVHMDLGPPFSPNIILTITLFLPRNPQAAWKMPWRLVRPLFSPCDSRTQTFWQSDILMPNLLSQWDNWLYRGPSRSIADDNMPMVGAIPGDHKQLVFLKCKIQKFKDSNVIRSERVGQTVINTKQVVD